MNRIALTSALILGLSAPAFANDQIADILGLDAGSVSTGTLFSIYNEDDNDAQDRAIAFYKNGGAVVSTQSVGVSQGHAQLAARFGLDPATVSVAEVQAIAAEDDNDIRDRRIAAAKSGGAVVSTQSVGVSGGHAQLAASIGVDPTVYSLSEVLVLKAHADKANDIN